MRFNVDILVDALHKYNSLYIAHLCTQSLTILSSPSYLEILSLEFSFLQSRASSVGDIIIPDSAGAMSKQRLTTALPLMYHSVHISSISHHPLIVAVQSEALSERNTTLK